MYQSIDQHFPGLKQINAFPPIYSIDDFFTATECELLIKESLEYLIPSPVVGKGAGETSTLRTSSTCFIDRADVPSIMCKACSLLLGKELTHFEFPQVGRYLPHAEYKAHYDAFDQSTEDGRRFSENGGQRICTILVYLNDVFAGGNTSFPSLNLTISPKRGKAIIFFPAQLDSTLDIMALHAAEPAVDEKWVCQIWVRQSSFYGQSSCRFSGPI